MKKIWKKETQTPPPISVNVPPPINNDPVKNTQKEVKNEKIEIKNKEVEQRVIKALLNIPESPVKKLQILQQDDEIGHSTTSKKRKKFTKNRCIAM